MKKIPVLGNIPESKVLFVAALILCVIIPFNANKIAAADNRDFINDIASDVAHKVVLSPSEKDWLNAGYNVRVRVGEVPPHHFYFHGEPYGLSIDYLKIIFTAFSIKHEFISQAGGTFPEALKNVISGNMVDVLPTLRKTPERERQMLFTDDYVFTPWAIFTRENSQYIGGLSDLNGKTVAVESGFILAQKLANDYPAIKVVEFIDTHSALEALALGQADAYAGDLSIGTFAIQRYGFTNVKVAAPTAYPPMSQAMAVRPDWPELVSIINKSLAVLTPDETQQIVNHTVSIRFEHEVSWRVMGGIAAVIALLAGIVLLVERHRLKKEIADRKQAEADSQVHQERMHTLLENAPDAILVYDVELGLFIEANSNAERLLGYSHEEILKSGPDRFYSPDQPNGKPVGDSIREHTDRVMDGSPLVFERSVLHASGMRIPCEVRLVRLPSKDLKLIRASFIDISERKLLENRLRESEERYRALFNNLGDAVFLVDEGLRFVSVNKVACDRLGYSEQELLSMGPRDIDDPDASALIPMRVEAIKKERKLIFESVHLAKDGRRVPVEINAQMVVLGGKAFNLAIARDITERKQTEEKLQKALVMNNQILDHAAIGIAVYEGQSGQCILANKTLADMLGGSVEQIVSNNFRRLHSWDKSGRLAMAEQVLHDNVLLRKDLEFDSTFGKHVNVDSSLSCFKLGNVTYLLRVDKDISDRKKIEIELQGQLKFMNTLLDAMPIPVYYKDLQGNYLGFNRKYEDIRGFDVVSVENEDKKIQGAPASSKGYEENWIDVINGGQNISYESKICLRSGEIMDVVFHKAPFSGSDETISGLIGAIIDVTERKKSEDMLRENEKIFSDILNGIKAGILVVDPETFTVVDVNSIAAEIIGLQPDQIIGSPCTSIKWTRGKCEKVHDSCPLLDRNIHDEEFWIERPDGRTVPIAKTVLSAQRSNKLLFYEILFDRAERKALEQQLAIAQRLESIGQLASGIAHEINTPLQYVGDNLSFLETAFVELTGTVKHAEDEPGLPEGLANAADREFLLEEIPKALAQSREGVSRVTSIVQAMKRFSHPGSDEMKLLDVNMAIENTVTVARNEWKYHSEIEFDLDPEAGSLMCFTGDFNQVLLNMLVNAAQAVNEKYKDRQDKGVIRLGTRRHEHALIVTIADTGTGIAEKNLHRIYDPFFTTKEVGKGTGQGLAIVHDIVVNKHGGSVEVQTELGKGTTFVLKFPLSGKHEEAA